LRKKILLLILSAILLLSACGSKATTDTGTKSASGGLEKLELILAAEGTTMFYAYVARDKGFFKEEGLDVELIAGKGGTYVVQQVGAGQVDFGITAIAAVLPAWDKDVALQSVYQVNYKNLFDFMVPKDSAITDIQQLKGKRIGVSDLSGGEVPMVRSILASAGLTVDKDVTLRAIGSEATSILTAFEKGDIEAYIGGAHDLVSLYARGFESKSLIPTEFQALPSTTIVASDKVIKERPELVEKVNRAIAKATDFAIKDPDAAFDLMKKVIPEQYTDEKVGRIFLDTFIELCTLKDPTKGYGYIEKASWQKLVDQFKQGDPPVITGDIDLDKHLNSSFLEKANEF